MKYTLALLAFAIWSCSNQNIATEQTNSTVDTTATHSSFDRERLDSLRQINERRPDSLPIARFADLEVAEAIAYGITKISTGNVFRDRDRSQFYTLRQAEIDSLLPLLLDSNNYVSARNYACFDPNMGVVFYDEAKRIQAYLQVCLSCNNMQINPGLHPGQDHTYGGMSLPARQLMKHFCEQWDMPRCPTRPSPFDFEDWRARDSLFGQ